MGPPALTPQTHHNQPRLGWVWAESARGPRLTKKRLHFKDGKSMIFVGGEGGGVAFILQPDG